MKNVRVGNEVFIKGWTTCFDCGKRIKFKLRSDIAILTDGIINACIDCYWDEYADIDQTPKTQAIIFRSTAGVVPRELMQRGKS